MASLPSCVAAFIDGHSVPVVVDSRLANSFYPPAWHCSSPVHVACRYSDGFTFAALVTLVPSAAVQCLVLGRDWSNSVAVSCGRFLLFFCPLFIVPQYLNHLTVYLRGIRLILCFLFHQVTLFLMLPVVPVVPQDLLP